MDCIKLIVNGMTGRLENVRKNVEVELEPIQEHQKLMQIMEAKNVKDHPR